MPITTSSYATSSNNTALYTKNERFKVPASEHIFESKAELDTQLGLEKGRVNNGLAMWVAGCSLSVTPEGVKRVWTPATGTQGHARIFTAFKRQFEFTNDAATLTVVTTTPTGGADGDFAIDKVAQLLWKRTAGVWAVVDAADGRTVRQASQSTTRNVVAADNNTVVPITGTPDYTITTATGPIFTVFTRLSAGDFDLLSGSGVTFILNGAVVTSVTISAKGSSILVEPGSAANEFFITKKGD